MDILPRLSQTKSWVDGSLVPFLTNHHDSMWAVGLHHGFLLEHNTTFWSGELRWRPTDCIFSMLKAKRTSSESNHQNWISSPTSLSQIPAFLDICSAQTDINEIDLSCYDATQFSSHNGKEVPMLCNLTSETRTQGCTGLKIWVWLWQHPLRWCLTAHISKTKSSTYWEHPSGFFLTVGSGVPDPNCLVSRDWNK